VTPRLSPYAGQTVVFATMHGKEELAQRAFAERLGASVIAPDHLDTDQLGTFAGDIPRTLSPRTAVRVKARLGIEITGLPFAMASEGSFRSTLVGVDTTEILLFLDMQRGLEIVEYVVESSTLPAARRVENVRAALAYAARVGFPEQGVLLNMHDGTSTLTRHGIATTTTLADVVARSLDEGMTLTVLPDHRAHRSPARAERIEALSDRMARRLATPCPDCSAPGYGIVDVERGLSCSLCENPTAVIAADIHGCGVCGRRESRPRSGARADPSVCELCNP